MRHFLNGIEIAPRNLPDIGVISDFTDRPSELELNIDVVILPREALTLIQAHLSSQGPFEGMPYTIQMEGGITLEYYVDFTEQAIFRDHEIEVKIKRRGGKDQFFENADGLTFELMKAKGINFDLISAPYVIIKDNVVEVGISMAIALYVMTRELIQAIRDLATAIENLVQAVTPNATLPPLPPLGSIIKLALAVVAQLIYTAFLLVAVIKMAQQLFDLIFPKVRYYNACKVKELLSKGCQYLGFSFQSTLLNSISGLSILPVPILKEKKSIWEYLQNDLNFAFNKGYPTASDSTPTLGSLITAIETQFNAKTKVINGVVYLEIRTFWQNITPNAIIPALALQGERQDEYFLNTDEAWKRYYIHYQVDYSDTHTLDYYDPTDAEYSTEPVSPINADLVTIKGLNDINIPFALGSRKNKLNWLEKFVKGFFEVVDSVTGVFGGGTNFASIIENRIGVLQISSQFFSQTKMMYLVGGKQPANYMDFLSAPNLWNKYHYINQIQLNSYKVRNEIRTRISSQDFVDLLGNNYAEINGTISEILRIEYIDEKSYALISYKEPDNYANGHVETLVINE
jgi:hypothetical protein